MRVLFFILLATSAMPTYAGLVVNGFNVFAQVGDGVDDITGNMGDAVSASAVAMEGTPPVLFASANATINSSPSLVVGTSTTATSLTISGQLTFDNSNFPLDPPPGSATVNFELVEDCGCSYEYTFTFDTQGTFLLDDIQQAATSPFIGTISPGDTPTFTYDFVSSGSSDVDLDYSLSITKVPEPSQLAMFGIAGLLSAATGLKRFGLLGTAVENRGNDIGGFRRV